MATLDKNFVQSAVTSLKAAESISNGLLATIDGNKDDIAMAYAVEGLVNEAAKLATAAITAYSAARGVQPTAENIAHLFADMTPLPEPDHLPAAPAAEPSLGDALIDAAVSVTGTASDFDVLKHAEPPADPNATAPIAAPSDPAGTAAPADVSQTGTTT